MFELTAVVAVIVGVVEAIKRTGYLTSQWAALVAIALGVLTFIFIGEATLGINAFMGVIAGLSASGLYSGTKATLGR